LLAGLKINNGKPGMGKACMIIPVTPELIGATVMQGTGHSGQGFRRG
jgi:hypothetical protein